MTPLRVTVDPRLGAVLPAAAVRAVAAAPAVLLDPSVPEALAALLRRDLDAVPDPGGTPVPGSVLLVAAPDPAAPDGAELLSAVAVMDRLRSPGGCPWDAEQTHSSLLRYLVEETYELYDALVAGDADAVREELGDVLLQVLFHARLAAETDGYGIDEVAADLATKLVGRHPHVFGDAEVVVSAADQDRRWEELKAVEKRRDSVLDGVARAQPGAALLGKYVSRARRGGVPDALLAGEGALAAAVVDTVLAGGDPEGDLRAAAEAVAARVRTAEASASRAGERLSPTSPEAWARHWR